jgi:hypothetical protein
VRTADSDNECDRSPSASGYSSESWRSPAFAVRKARQGHNRNVSGMAFCLSPLVRASTYRHWSKKGLPPDMAVSGEARTPMKPHLSTAEPGGRRGHVGVGWAGGVGAVFVIRFLC